MSNINIQTVIIFKDIVVCGNRVRLQVKPGSGLRVGLYRNSDTGDD